MDEEERDPPERREYFDSYGLLINSNGKEYFDEVAYANYWRGMEDLRDKAP